jgi:glyoxylase-like metal-dependent hydrolase (beta-lactamase superfamily II)
VILERATNPQFVSNTYLLADGRGGPAFFIDAGGPVQPLIAAAERLGLKPTHVLLTHHHYDHVVEVPALRARWPELRVLASESERELLGAAATPGAGEGEVELLVPDQTLSFGALEVRALATPGHTAGMLSFLVAAAGEQERHVFTGDTLFKDSVGGVRAPGHSTYADLRDSIMEKLMDLPGATIIEPGHAQETSVEREWEHNPFVRVWRGLDGEGEEACLAFEKPATLVLLASDYDGGTKAWVRWEDGSDDIVPGSQVKRL